MDLTTEITELLDAMPDGIVLSTLDGRIVHVNRQLEKLVGCPGADLVGQELEVLVPERLRDLHREHRARYVAADLPVRAIGAGIDTVVLRADGTEVAVDIALSPIALGNERAVLSSVRDVTEHHDANARLRAVSEVTDALLAGYDSDDVLRLIARHARELVGADLATIAAPFGDRETLSIRVAEGQHAHRLEGMSFSLDRSISGTVIRSGKAEMIEDCSWDSRVYQPVVALGDLGPAVVVPLAARGNAFGTILVANRRGGRTFTEPELALVETFAAQAAVTLEQARTQRELQRLLVFEERERIARELHDTVIQRLFATGMALQTVVDVAGSPEAVERLQGAIDDLDTTIREIRTTIFALEGDRRPGSGVRAAVLSVATAAATSLGFEPQVRFEGTVDASVPDEVAEHLLSTLREALSNVARHAGARHADVSLAVDRDTLRMRVVDDGVGIPDRIAHRGLGLRNMGERATDLGGSLEVTRGLTGGTVLDWRVPLRPHP